MRVLKTIYSNPEPKFSPAHPGPTTLPKRYRARTNNKRSWRAEDEQRTRDTNQANLSSYRKGEFFKALSAAALADLEPLLAPSTYPAGRVLFSETQPTSGIYVVLEGEVKLSINSS